MQQPAPWWSDRTDVRDVRVIGRASARVRVLALLFLFLVPAWAAAVGSPATATRRVGDGAIQEAPTLAALAAGCTGHTRWPQAPDGENGAVAQDAAAFVWRYYPPVSGNFALQPWTGGRILAVGQATVLTPADALQLLYRGKVVVWYHPEDAPVEAMTRLLTWAETAGDNVYVAPWSGDPARWPRGRGVVFTAWDITQPCIDFDSDVADGFLATLAEQVPAPGVGLAEGQTPPLADLISRRG